MKWVKMDMQEIHKVELSVLLELDRICSELGINYWIMYGTLLGAVRHKGFIPWDDDLDVGMHIDDLKKLSRYFTDNAENLKPLELDSWEHNRQYPFFIPRLCNHQFKVTFDNMDYQSGIFIDIYPFFPFGGQKEIEGWSKKSELLKRLAKKASFSSIDGFLYGNKALHRILNIPECIYCKKRGNTYYFRKIEAMLPNIDSKNTEYYGVPGLIHEWDFFNRDMLNEFEYIPFENTKVKAPKMREAFLRHSYGDYMKLPPESDRNPYHGYSAYRADQ